MQGRSRDGQESDPLISRFELKLLIITLIEIEIKYLTHFVTQPAGRESRQSLCQLKIKRSQALAEKEVPLLLISLSLGRSFALFKSTHLKKNLIGYLAAAKPVIGKSTPFLSSLLTLSLFLSLRPKGDHFAVAKRPR